MGRAGFLLHQEAPWRECRTCRCLMFNAEAQGRRGDGRVEHVERVEGESVSQGAPSLRDGAMKSEYSHQ